MEKFKQLGLTQDLIKVLEKKGFTQPSEIQEKAIPLALEGVDIIGGSATGSGKTLAFATPIMEKLIPNKTPQALILTPTRELAEQITQAIKEFSEYKKLNITSIYGGVNINPQIDKLKRTDIVVGTPGRILDHLQRNTLKLNNIKFLVLDEVDRMFDMGFHIDVEKILSQLPKERQTMLFSATISRDIDHLAKKYTKNPIEISVKSYVDTTQLRQVFYDIPDYEKFSLLVHLLKNENSKLVMVFCNTRRNVDFVTKNLKKQNIYAQAIHGGLSQNKRTQVLGDFHDKHTHVLICTDVAARGLDIKGVSHVYNYDIPKTADEYTHRIGRTARAGKNGIAISLLSSRDYQAFQQIETNPSFSLTKEKTPQFEKVTISIDSQRGRSGNFRGRFKPRFNSNSKGSRRFGSRRFGSRDNRDGNRSRNSRDNRNQDNRNRNSRYGNSRYNNSKPRQKRDYSKINARP